MYRFDPLLIGSSRVPGLDVDLTSRTLDDRLAGAGGLTRAAFKIRGRSRELERLLRDRATQLLIAHFAPDGYRVMPLAEQLGIPLVVVCHGSDVLLKDEHARQVSFGQRRLAGNWWRLAERAAVFVSVSHFLRRHLVARGVPENKILTHHTGVPIPTGTRVRSSAYAERPQRLLFVGRLVENKGCHLLLKAFAAMPSGRESELCIVGEGPQLQRLKTQAATLRVSHRIRFLGRASPADVHLLMTESDALAIPSIEIGSGASENLSTVAVEAQARGLPVVGFATGAVPEAVAHGVSGLLVEPGDLSALASALSRVLTDRDLAEALGEQGRIRARTHFDIRLQTASLEEQLIEHLGIKTDV